MAERDDDRPRQGGQIDHARRVEAVLGVPHHIGQDQTPLGIGIDHLDRVALHRCHHIARPLRRAGGHILDQTDQTDHMGGRAAAGQRMHDTRHHTCTPHIHGHIFHAARRLEADPAGIEHHALADQSQRRALGTLPLQNRDLGGAFRPLPHTQKRTHAHLGQIRLFKDLDLKPKRAHPLQPGGEIARGQDIGGFIDQVAGEKHTFGHGQKRCGVCAGFIGFGHHDARILRLIFLAGFVGGEIIAAQRKPKGQIGDACRAASRNQKRLGPFELGQGCTGTTRLLGAGTAGKLDRHQPSRRQTRGPVQHHTFAGLDLFPCRAFDQPRQCATRQPAQPPPSRVELAIGADQKAQLALRALKCCKIGVDERNGDRRCHAMVPSERDRRVPRPVQAPT